MATNIAAEFLLGPFALFENVLQYGWPPGSLQAGMEMFVSLVGTAVWGTFAAIMFRVLG